jgi:hypothetical protein
MDTLNVLSYSIYLIFVFSLTLIVSKILFTNSLSFMKVIFKDREHLAIATNKLFQMGFFLLSLGLGLWYMTTNLELKNNRMLLENLSIKTGFFTLFLGLLLFANIYLFFRGMRVSKNKTNNYENLNESKATN